MVTITQCQCQHCIYCHGGGCTEEAVMVLRFKTHNRRAQVATCENCGVCLLAGNPEVFEKVEEAKHDN